MIMAILCKMQVLDLYSSCKCNDQSYFAYARIYVQYILQMIYIFDPSKRFINDEEKNHPRPKEKEASIVH